MDVDLSAIANPAPNITEISIAGILTKGGFSLLDLTFFIIGLIFLSSLLMSAFSYITASGDASKLNAASSRITNSLMGIVIVFAAFVIVKLAATIMGYGQGANSIVPF